MNFEDFLKIAVDKAFWETNKVLCFNGKTYTSLFFRFLWDKLISLDVLPYPKKNFYIESLDRSYEFILGQKILGIANVYWLGEVLISSSGRKDKFQEYITNYAGPNIIVFFCMNEINKQILNKQFQIIYLEPVLCKKDFELITNFFSCKISSKKNAIVSQIFEQQEKLGLDQILLLINYLEYVSNSTIELLPEYFFQITGSSLAVNRLSDLFFSYQSKQFFSLWVKLEHIYSDMFWVAFWSDQIWRAHHVVDCLNRKDFVKAKQFAQGLPFKFIKKYWSNFKMSYLHELYEDLYKIDFKVKGGSNFNSLDFFYLKHFNVVNQ